MICFVILLQTEFRVDGKKLFDLGKATEKNLIEKSLHKVR